MSDAEFYLEIAEDFDTSEPLEWSYSISKISTQKMQSVFEEVQQLGFEHVEPFFSGNDDEFDRYLDHVNDSNGPVGRIQFEIGFNECVKHSLESFLERIKELEAFAIERGLKFEVVAAGTCN